MSGYGFLRLVSLGNWGHGHWQVENGRQCRPSTVDQIGSHALKESGSTLRATVLAEAFALNCNM